MKRRFRAALCALTIGTVLVSTTGIASAEPGVDPADVTLTLSPGESKTITKTVSTPAIPPKPDITFLIDTTGSMGPVISNVQTNANSILNNVASAQPDAQFAVAEYKDTTDATPFRVAQNLTGDQTAVTNGLNSLVASGGGDLPEANINGLFQVATGAVSFRPNSSRIVLLIGDAPSHDPSNGHTLADAISALQAADITVLALDLAQLDSTGQATAITNATGGELFSGINPSEVSDTILAALSNLPVTVTHKLRDCDSHLNVSLTPDSRTVTSGATATFSETISVAADAIPGSTLTCKVDFLLNGMLAAGDTPCETPIAPRVGTVSGSGTASSGTVSAGGVGTYNWTATYSGDASNNPVTSPCGDEQVVIVKATPGITTKPSGSVPAGGGVSGTATGAGGVNPTWTVPFKLFAPGDTALATPIAPP